MWELVGFFQPEDSSSQLNPVSFLLILCLAPVRIEDRWKCLLNSDSLDAAGETPPLLGRKMLSSDHCCSPATSAAACSPSFASLPLACCSPCLMSDLACLVSVVSEQVQLVESRPRPSFYCCLSWPVPQSGVSHGSQSLPCL